LSTTISQTHSIRPHTFKVGIDHSFSFHLRYFEVHHLLPDWPTFLDDFQHHWPTDDDHVYADFIRDGLVGNGADQQLVAGQKTVSTAPDGKGAPAQF